MNWTQAEVERLTLGGTIALVIPETIALVVPERRGMTIIVYGTPAPQGSKRYVGNGRMIESSAKVKPWREAVKWAALEVTRGQGTGYSKPPFCGPIAITINFTLPRPAKPKFAVPATKPDIDKLIRSTLDALTDSGVIEDDARVVSITARKSFAGGAPHGSLNQAGAIICIQEAA